MRGIEGSGEAEWMASEIGERPGEEVEVVPVPSPRFPRPVRRPSYSVMGCSGPRGRSGRRYRSGGGAGRVSGPVSVIDYRKTSNGFVR